MAKDPYKERGAFEHAIRTQVRRQVLKHLKPRAFETLLSATVLETVFPDIYEAKIFEAREQLWAYAADHIGRDRPVTFTEFGVFEGYSILRFMELFSNPHSRFLGFDSFQGLPERWTAKKGKGTFAVDNLPELNDPRGELVPGWFQNTISTAISAVEANPENTLLVHLDADLFSATLFVLSSLHFHVDDYYCVFDEFPGHECRALYTYLSAYGASVQFLGLTNPQGTPSKVFVRITTFRGSYDPDRPSKR